MEKKHLRKFIALFDSLPEAAEILSGKYDDNQTEMESLSSAVSTAYLKNCSILDDPENKFLTKVFDRIDDNLYASPSCCEKFIKDLLGGFAGISPFLVFSPNMEWLDFDAGSCPDGDIFYPSLYFAALSFIVGFEESPEKSEDELSDAEKYVLSCSRLLHRFSETLDARCLRFDLNLFDIQTDLEIYILQERNYEELASYGYLDKVIQLSNRQETAQNALSIKSFPYRLKVKKPLELAKLCKEIFTRHNSPKDYAIMLCLLVEHQYVSIQDRKRSDFFRSWYIYLDKPVPNNFEAENKFIDVSRDGLYFYNDNDVDYKELKKYFNKSLHELKNTVV